MRFSETEVGAIPPMDFDVFIMCLSVYHHFLNQTSKNGPMAVKAVFPATFWARLSCDHFQPGLQRQLLWLCAPDEPLDHARFIQVMNIYVDQGKTDDGQFT